MTKKPHAEGVGVFMTVYLFAYCSIPILPVIIILSIAEQGGCFGFMSL